MDKMLTCILKRQLKDNIYIKFGTIGGSMKPFILPGDSVTASPVTLDKLKIGDIVIFKNYFSGLIIAHRLIEKNGNTLITKGDCHKFSDSPVSEQELIGKVINVKRKGRTYEIEGLLFSVISSIIAFFSKKCPYHLYVIMKGISVIYCKSLKGLGT